MNKFRANLHPAFFNKMVELHYNAADQAWEGEDLTLPEVVVTGKDRSKKKELNKVEQDKNDEQKQLEKNNLEQTEGVKEDILQKPEFSNIAGKLASEMSSRYTDMEQWKNDRKRFQERLKSKADNGNGEEYVKIWDKKIKDGFDNLIKSLEENKYFDDLSDEEKTQKKAEILVKYSKEVRSQYEKYIWRAGDKTFEGVKDSIFGPNSEEYPANKIYTKLTGAATIFRREKSKVTTHHVDSTHKTEQGSEDTEEVSNTTKQRIEFLAHDLPNYLWEVKDKTTLQKIASWVPFIKHKVDKASLEDKKQLETFIKATDELGGDKPELKLLKVFNDLPENATDAQVREALELHGDKSIKNIKRAFKFYNETHHIGRDVASQHALYLSILEIVENQGGFDNAISKFKEDVEEYKNRETKENKEGKEYKNGEILNRENHDLKEFADSLGITDYTSATRLNKKTEEYFETTDVVDILADLNNDGALTFSDSGLTKTGLQFKGIYNTLTEEVALKNLLDAAKLKNNKDSSLKEEEITKDEIKKGNKKLILLLQNIISNPGVDLYDLMTYGADSSERFAESSKLLEEADSQKDVAADKLLRDIDLSQIKIDGVEVASAEGLHQAVSGALYAEYARGVGLGGNIPFDKWVKGVSLNGGIQASNKGVDVGLTLAYNKEIPLGKGWNITPGASIGFVPMFKCGASEGVEIAKTWITNKLVQNKVGLRVSFSQIAGGIQVYSAFVGLEKDYVEGIEGSRKEISSLFKRKIISPLLDKIAEEFSDKEFDLTDDNNAFIVSGLVAELVGELYKGEENKLNINNENEDMKAMRENTVNFLKNYNKAPIQSKVVRDQIAYEMADSYSVAWAEQNKHNLEGKIKFTDAMVGASFVSVGAAGVSVLHAGVGFTKYVKDIYGDRSVREHIVEVDEKFKDREKWDQEMLADFNKNMPEGSKFQLIEIGEGEDKKTYIKIPAKAIRNCDILFNPGMKGLIKKDEEGNVLLSDETVMNKPTVLTGSARKMTSVLIGGGDENSAIRLDSVMNDGEWFTTGEIDTSRLTGKETIETKTENLNLDIMSEKAKAIASKVYSESLKVTSNRLYAISHDIRNNQGVVIQRKWDRYSRFADAMKDQNYSEAKDILVNMLPDMDRYVGEGVEFSSITEDLNSIEEKDLGQALLSVNNIFARVTSVHGGKDGQYHFKRYRNGELVDRNMGDVISGRAKEISRKIASSGLDESTKQAYQNLINFAEKDRESNPDKYSEISQNGKVYEGAIGINLGNAVSLENPLFNPEVYESPVMDSSELNFEGKDELQEHIMKDVIAKNKSLLQPMLSALNLDGNEIVVKSYENGKITLDIDGKNVILSADMKFGYFAQCVNHMLLIDNITAEIPGENVVTFKSSVIRDGKVLEGTKGSLPGKIKTGVYVSTVVDTWDGNTTGENYTTPSETLIEQKTQEELTKKEAENGTDSKGQIGGANGF